METERDLLVDLTDIEDYDCAEEVHDDLFAPPPAEMLPDVSWTRPYDSRHLRAWVRMLSPHIDDDGKTEVSGELWDISEEDLRWQLGEWAQDGAEYLELRINDCSVELARWV